MKKILPLAVAATLAGVNSAQAVVVNPDGHGQVLLYPFYTTEGGQNTLINVVNTTDQFKAVKVRILESMNSQEVLDFNLYLTPWDHWSAVITDNGSGTGAVIRSGDSTCTVPNDISNGTEVAFREFEYQGDSVNGLERTKEGYVEIIEMATLDENDPGMAEILDDTVHKGGVPDDCGTVQAAWRAGGYFQINQSNGVLPQSGGLYGYGVIIDVQEGTDATYDAVALDAWQDVPQHTNPGSLSPSLADAIPFASAFDGITGQVQDLSPVSGLGIDAVSAVLMHQAIVNDYVLDTSIAAGTDWVMTFPTKRFYVNVQDEEDVREPFTEIWDPEVSQSCEPIGITYYDREEQPQVPEDVDFSPAPVAGVFTLCYEANVMTFDNSDVLEASTRSGVNLDVIYENGWANIAFNGEGRELDVADGTLIGLPVVGFAVQEYVNNSVQNGVLSNYAGAVTHKGVRSLAD